MLKQINLVSLFNRAFKIKEKKYPSRRDKKRYTLSYNLMKEELDEYLQACENKDLTEIADAITDMYYILHGITLSHGMQYIQEKLFLEVHRSNMSKLDDDNKPIYSEQGKVLKSENYSPPNLLKILNDE